MKSNSRILSTDSHSNNALAVTVLSVIIIIGSFTGPSADVLAASFRATMSGNNENPPVETHVNGYTAFRTASNDTTIKYKINLTGLNDTLGADIYKGNKSQDGDKIIDLLNNSKRNKIRLGMAIRGNISDTDLTGPFKGKALGDLLSAMESGNTYVNIITEDHPSGIVRGQIKSESSKYTDRNSSVTIS